MYIDGDWTEATSGKTFDDYDPSTRKVFAKISQGERNDARRETPPVERAMYLRRAADIVEGKQQEFAQVLIEESGSTFGKAMFEVGYSAGLLREAAAQVHNVTGEILPSNTPGKFYMVMRQPVGVVSVISPWNFPLLLSLRGVAFAMAFGNTIVLKPSEETPISGGLLIAQVFEEAGLPGGVFNVVTCSRDVVEEVGDELVSHSSVRRISFTGSTATGRHVAEKAGRHLKRIVLELGGKNPLIVLRDADLDYAVNAASFGSFFHQGQICMSVERIIAEEPVADEFAEKLAEKAQRLKVGDPRDHDTVIGPIINDRQLDKIKAHVDEAVQAGARSLCGGKHEGPYYYPTVLTGVTADMRVFREETFGPVVSVMPVRDEEEAVHLANDTTYGLSAGIITGDLQKGLELAERIESGMVHINDASVHDEPHCPFGGVKGSGLGRHGGKASIEEFTEQRWITLQRAPRAFPF
jgi:aldehyde dehydrogenase (NAD+)